MKNVKMNLFDVTCGALGGLAAFKVSKACLSGIYRESGAFARTGCFVLEAVTAYLVMERIACGIFARRKILAESAAKVGEEREQATENPYTASTSSNSFEDFVRMMHNKFGDDSTTHNFYCPNE